MKNIQFIDRKQELQKLQKLRKSSFFLVVKGRRRIGKTRLLKTAFPDAAYIFIWPDKSLNWLLQQISAEQGVPLFTSFKDLVESLLEKEKTLILDEFQNFMNIDRSVYGEIQKLIDDKKAASKPFKIAVAGSSHALMNKVFNDAAAPLYGRRTDEIALGHLPPQELWRELQMPLEEFIKLWSVFEGVPYYYELIDTKASAEENIKALVLSKEAQLQEEGKAILAIEFGKDSKTYNTVLAGIAEGKTKLSELSSLFENKKNEVVKYLDILRKEFKLVQKNTPATENPSKSREGRYVLTDNFLSFWFYFGERLRNYREQERFEEIEQAFNKQFNAYVGRKFEEFIILLIKQKSLLKELQFTTISRQWGKTFAGKETYEIDILALNETNKDILFGECKWSENVDAKSLLREVQEKANNVRWHNEERKERYALFAKSFKKKVSLWNNKPVSCFDLKDIEKALRKSF